MSKCNVQQLVDNAGCFFCLSPGQIQAARLSLLCKIAQQLNPSVSCSPNSLLANATGFVTLDNGMRDVVKAQLLCEILKGGGGGGGGSTFTIIAPSDTDAFNYWVEWIVGCFTGNGCTVFSSAWSPGGHIVLPVACATVCGATQSSADALNTLVTSLKSAGLWNLMDVIYPFMGGTAASCALNLKNPNSFAITWHGTVTFDHIGVTGDGSTGYGDTGYNPSVSGSSYTLNSAGLGFNSSSNNQSALGGAISIAGLGIYVQNGIVGWFGEVNAFDPAFPGVPNAALAGNYAVNRTAANLTTLYTPSGTSSSATASSALTGFSLFILALNSNSSPINFSPATIKFAWSGAGFTGPQETTLEGIVNTFVASK